MCGAAGTVPAAGRHPRDPAPRCHLETSAGLQAALRHCSAARSLAPTLPSPTASANVSVVRWCTPWPALQATAPTRASRSRLRSAIAVTVIGSENSDGICEGSVETAIGQAGRGWPSLHPRRRRMGRRQCSHRHCAVQCCHQSAGRDHGAIQAALPRGRHPGPCRHNQFELGALPPPIHPPDPC